MPAPTLATQRGAFGAGGGWVDLPDTVAVGETFDVPFQALLVAIFAEAEPELVESEFELDEVDGGDETASVSGALVWRSRVELLTVKYEGTVSMTVDLAARRVRQIEVEATASYGGEANGIAIEGDAKFQATLTVMAGDDAREALAEVPETRAVPWSCPERGVELALASSWESQPLTGAERDGFPLVAVRRRPCFFAVGNSFTPARLEV